MAGMETALAEGTRLELGPEDRLDDMVAETPEEENGDEEEVDHNPDDVPAEGRPGGPGVPEVLPTVSPEPEEEPEQQE